MRKPIPTIAILLIVIFSPALKAEAQTIQLSGQADCEGWNTNANLVFPDDVFSAMLSYHVVIKDEAGIEIATFAGIDMVERFENPVIMVMHSNVWGLELDGDYEAISEYGFLGTAATMNVSLTCGQGSEYPEPEAGACPQPPGMWKTHTDAWPVDFLMVGDVEMNRDELVGLLRTPSRGNPNFLLARELVAAKLNLANGCFDTIGTVIEEADQFLVDHPLADGLLRNIIYQSRDLRHALADFNKADCSGAGSGDEEPLDGLRQKAAAANVSTSFGALKAMYRDATR